MSKKHAIGFPAGLLGERALRLPVLHAGEGYLVISKPAGMLADAHPEEPDYPSMVAGLVAQAGKPELMRLGVQTPYAVCAPDAQVSGLAFIACNKDSAAHYRNLYGSYKMRMSFTFLAQTSARAEDSFDCMLPIAAHSHEPCMLVSHKTGKQAETAFRRIERLGDWDLWEAHTTYLRRHQIRLHAMECGLNIVGESLYSQAPPIYLSQLKRRYVGRSNEKPLYPTIALHMHHLSVETAEDSSVDIACPLPNAFSVMLEKLRDRVKTA